MQDEGNEFEFPPFWPETEPSGSRSLVALAAQIMLDRSRHSPGVTDGYMGGNTMRPTQRFRQAPGLPAEGGIDPQLIRSPINSQRGEIFETYSIACDEVDGPSGSMEVVAVAPTVDQGTEEAVHLERR